MLARELHHDVPRERPSDGTSELCGTGARLSSLSSCDARRQVVRASRTALTVTPATVTHHQHTGDHAPAVAERQHAQRQRRELAVVAVADQRLRIDVDREIQHGPPSSDHDERKRRPARPDPLETDHHEHRGDTDRRHRVAGVRIAAAADVLRDRERDQRNDRERQPELPPQRRARVRRLVARRRLWTGVTSDPTGHQHHGDTDGCDQGDDDRAGRHDPLPDGRRHQPLVHVRPHRPLDQHVDDRTTSVAPEQIEQVVRCSDVAVQHDVTGVEPAEDDHGGAQTDEQYPGCAPCLHRR
jgi:hypothetical protein